RRGTETGCRASTMASLRAAGAPPLCSLQRTLGRALPTGMEAARAMREGSERRDPQVDARLLSGLLQRLDQRGGARGTDLPPLPLLGGSCGCGARPPGGGSSAPRCAHRGEDQQAALQGGPVAVLLVGEGVVAQTRLIAGIARLLSRLDAAKERLIGLVEARER